MSDKAKLISKRIVFGVIAVLIILLVYLSIAWTNVNNDSESDYYIEIFSYHNTQLYYIDYSLDEETETLGIELRHKDNIEGYFKNHDPLYLDIFMFDRIEIYEFVNIGRNIETYVTEYGNHYVKVDLLDIDLDNFIIDYR